MSKGDLLTITITRRELQEVCRIAERRNGEGKYFDRKRWGQIQFQKFRTRTIDLKKDKKPVEIQ